MYIRIDNRKIHYKKIGKGTPLLMVHGWGGTLYNLLSLAEKASRKHTVYILDLPGFGKSDNPPPHWGIEGYAEIIVKFMKQLRLQRPHYFGHSFGGEIGIFIASRAPQAFDRLILSNSSYKRSHGRSWPARLFHMSRLKDVPFFSNLIPFFRNYYYRLLHKNSDMVKFPHLESNFRKIMLQDLTEQAKKIQNQTLLVWGEEDKDTPVLWAYELKKNIRNSYLHIFPEKNHNLPIRFPNEVWSVIEPFLRA